MCFFNVFQIHRNVKEVFGSGLKAKKFVKFHKQINFCSTMPVINIKNRMKIIIVPALLIGLSLCSCKDKVAEDANKIKQVAVSKGLSLFEAFNAHNWAAMALMYEEHARFMDPSFGTVEVTQSRKEIEEKYKALESMFPDIQDSLCYMSPCDSNKIVVEFVSKGTAPDGSAFRLPITSILTFKNGLIVSDHTYYDNSQSE
jgi:hypothetical protein